MYICTCFYLKMITLISFNDFALLKLFVKKKFFLFLIQNNILILYIEGKIILKTGFKILYLVPTLHLSRKI